jgi:hypothetical protein
MNRGAGKRSIDGRLTRSSHPTARGRRQHQLYPQAARWDTGGAYV